MNLLNQPPESALERVEQESERNALMAGSGSVEPA
jgi:hypothetical protein